MARYNGRVVRPEDLGTLFDADDELECPTCSHPVAYRKAGTDAQGAQISRPHFWHFNETNPNCASVGESKEHAEMKLAALDMLSEIVDGQPDVEVQIGDHIADVAVVFDEVDGTHGNGIAVECQYRHRDKAYVETTEHYLKHGYTVCWVFHDEIDRTRAETDLQARGFESDLTLGMYNGFSDISLKPITPRIRPPCDSDRVTVVKDCRASEFDVVCPGCSNVLASVVLSPDARTIETETLSLDYDFIHGVAGVEVLCPTCNEGIFGRTAIAIPPTATRDDGSLKEIVLRSWDEVILSHPTHDQITAGGGRRTDSEIPRSTVVSLFADHADTFGWTWDTLCEVCQTHRRSSEVAAATLLDTSGGVGLTICRGCRRETVDSTSCFLCRGPTADNSRATGLLFHPTDEIEGVCDECRRHIITGTVETHQ